MYNLQVRVTYLYDLYGSAALLFLRTVASESSRQTDRQTCQANKYAFTACTECYQ